MKNLVNVIWSFMCVHLGLEKDYQIDNLIGVDKPTFSVRGEDLIPNIPQKQVISP